VRKCSSPDFFASNNDEIRMTNDEINPSDEMRMGSACFRLAAPGISADRNGPPRLDSSVRILWEFVNRAS
jgi:hypothetical protein